MAGSRRLLAAVGAVKAVARLVILVCALIVGTERVLPLLAAALGDFSLPGPDPLVSWNDVLFE